MMIFYNRLSCDLGKKDPPLSLCITNISCFEDLENNMTAEQIYFLPSQWEMERQTMRFSPDVIYAIINCYKYCVVEMFSIILQGFSLQESSHGQWTQDFIVYCLLTSALLCSFHYFVSFVLFVCFVFAFWRLLESKIRCWQIKKIFYSQFVKTPCVWFLYLPCLSLPRCQHPYNIKQTNKTSHWQIM